MRAIRSIIRRLGRNTKGSIFVETAFALPVLIFLVMSSIEIGNYLLLNQKLQNAAMSMADLAARDETLSVGQLDDMFSAINFIVEPFDFGASGAAIVTGVSAVVDNVPLVYWQRTGGGAISASSQVGTVGAAANIDSNLPVRADETIIVAEIFYDYEPFFGLLIDPARVRHVAYFRPRLGSLQTLDP
jgi:Flp pilus assembly protein TadG